MIKTILFDFGDIFINLDKSATTRELQTLGLNDFTPQMLQWNAEYEKGLLASDIFISNYQNCFPNVSRKQLIDTWNSILLDFPLYRLHFLQQLALQKKFRLLLLSNTNEIHINWIKEYIPHYEGFKSCFDDFYLSHEIGMRKPDEEVYRFVLDKHQLKPEEVLFIDDTKENTDAANQLGIHTWNLNPDTEDIIELFTKQRHLF